MGEFGGFHKCFQVSELSERQSVGSFEISSSSEDDFEDGDGTEEEDERDQEYTIYSVLPNRQLEVVNKLPAKSQNLRPKKTSAERRSVCSVSITSAPQSCSVHEGKILTLTCEVAGPKYTGGRATYVIWVDCPFLYVKFIFQMSVGFTGPRDWRRPSATGFTGEVPCTTWPSSTLTPPSPASTACAPLTTRRRCGAGSGWT